MKGLTRLLCAAATAALIIIASAGGHDGAADEAGRSPAIYVCLLARNALLALPYTLGQLEQQDYDKSRMALDLRTDHNVDDTGAWLERYASRARSHYRRVALMHGHDGNYEDELENDGTWSAQHWRQVNEHRLDCMTAAQDGSYDYVLMLDAYAFLVDAHTIRALVAAERAIVAPLLVDAFSNYR